MHTLSFFSISQKGTQKDIHREQAWFYSLCSTHNADVEQSIPNMP